MQNNTLIVTKGHPFDKGAFLGMLDTVFATHELGEYTHVEHPAALAVLAPEALAAYQAVLFYDMPGVRFGAGGPDYPQPPASLQTNLQAATERGIGLVFLHHAIAGWPAWEGYAELLGGRFCYTEQRLRGAAVADSGYRHGVQHDITVVAEHPVTSGLPPTFPMTDELYLFEVFDDAIEPLLASSYTFTGDNFYSAQRAVVDGRMYDNDGWSHVPGSNLVGWTRQQDASRIVYLQGGDDPEAYANPHYQQLIGNALGWVRE